VKPTPVEPFPAAPTPAASSPVEPLPAAEPPPGQVAVDPELSRPLVPLDQFQLQAQQPAGPAPKPTPEIRYALRINGLRQIGLDGRFRGLSNLARGGGRAIDEAQVRARAEEDVEILGRLLRSEGYFDQHTDVAIATAPAAGAPMTVTLTVTPSQQYRLGEIVVTGPPTRPPGLPRQDLALSTGQPLVAASVLSAEADVSVRLPERGYPFVKVGKHDIALDEATHRGDYTLPVDPGPRSSFGRFIIAGQPVFPPSHVAVIARFKPGQLYDSRLVDDLRKALVATQIYGQLGVEPVQTDRPGPDGTTQADLRINGSQGRSHVLSATAGYDTGLGPSLSASWTALNFLPPEGALTVSGIGGTQQQQLAVTFTQSNWGQRDRSLTFGIQGSRESINPYDAETGQVSIGISRQSTPLWQKRWPYSAQLVGLITSESAFDIFAGQDERKLYKIVALPMQLEYDGSDSLLNPTRGFHITGRLSPEVSIQQTTFEYVKGIIDVAGYWPVSRPLVLAARLQIGSMLGASWFDLAPSRRFYAGGGSSVGSVRGFAYQSLGPKDPSNNALGGSAVTDFSFEARYRFGTLGMVAFLDGGQVYQTATPQFSDLRYGVGVGARYYTSIGPIRIDVATPLSRRPGEGVIGVYVSIGQAF
jgi:translocation and assembly module TamA